MGIEVQTAKTIGKRDLGFLLSEANGKRSRENVTLVSGQNLQAGAVLGKQTSGGKYAVFNNDLSDGTQTVAGILCYTTDASGGDKEVVIIARDAEVIGDELVWANTEDEADVAAGVAELLTLGILVR